MHEHTIPIKTPVEPPRRHSQMASFCTNSIRVCRKLGSFCKTAAPGHPPQTGILKNRGICHARPARLGSFLRAAISHQTVSKKNRHLRHPPAGAPPHTRPEIPKTGQSVTSLFIPEWVRFAKL